MQQKVKFARPDSSHFFSTLRKKVNAYFIENNISKTADYRMVIKTIAMFSIYFIPFALILTGSYSIWTMLLLCVIMGIGIAGIGFSVMHDANHGAYSSNKTINYILGYAVNLIGGSAFTWKVQHNVLHHTYTNIYELDEDIHDKPMLRLSPHGKLKPIHKYQHWYGMFLYSLATISWVIKKDFAQLKSYNQSGLTKKIGFQPVKQTIILILSKIFYIAYILVLPIIVLPIAWWQVIIGFLVMHMVAGFILTIVFQLAHVVDGPDHHRPVENGNMENTWAIHQLLTTANFAKKNRILSWFVGGLNYQIEHHLFPHICHIHYKAISDIVKKTAQDFNLPYYDQPTFRYALYSHLSTLKKLGNGEAIPNWSPSPQKDLIHEV